MVKPVRYSPPEGHRFDVELIDASDLRERVVRVNDRGFERVDFLCMIFVRSGSYEHTVDFETYRCSAGSCLLIRPGQVHRFGSPGDWDGGMMIVRSELTDAATDNLPTYVGTHGELTASITELFARMRSDASIDGGPDDLNTLLALEARVLMTRLRFAHTRSAVASLIDPLSLERVRSYRAAIENDFRRWHLVAPYVRQLGCSQKTLNRATQAVSAVTAKEMLVERIVLEAKRLLAHTTEPAASIAAQLGFAEPSNFVKFFRRETGTTPGSFRAVPRDIQ